MILECSSKGDKRFSAFSAKIKIFGKNDTIENHYQMAKRIGEFKPESWRDIKGKKFTHFELDNKKIPLELSGQFYDFLWIIYLDSNPFLRKYSSMYSDYGDMFKSKKSYVCQADSIRKYHNNRESIIDEIGDFLNIMKIEKTKFKLKKSLCFTGHRPNKLFGYDWHTEKNKKLMNLLFKNIIYNIKNNNVNTFISGGALGIDMMSFYIVNYIKNKHNIRLKNILALPFKNQGIKWNDTDIKKLNYYKKIADEVIFVDECELIKYNNNLNGYGNYHISKMQKRNEFMVDLSDIVLAVWNGSKSGTKNCIDYANKNNKILKIIDPREI